MRWSKFGVAGLPAFTLLLVMTPRLSAQGLLVDQASGTLAEVVTVATQIPDNQIAQSFTPSLSAVGFVQFSEDVPAYPGNNEVTFMVNLRAGAYNGPILSSTTPVVLVNHFTQIGTFYYPANIPVTPGQLYFFEPVLLSVGFLNVGYKAPSSYLGGDAWNNGVPSGGTADYWFREGIVGVPEPATIWLLLLGSGVFIWRRRLEKSSWL